MFLSKLMKSLADLLPGPFHTHKGTYNRAKAGAANCIDKDASFF